MSTVVTDADEEVFLLYTALLVSPSEDAHTAGFHGLGHVDSRSDVLSVKLELTTPVLESDPGVAKSKGRSKRKAKTNGGKRTVEVELAQDKTALRTRKGDTGSVLWQASVDLAQVLLQQHHVHHVDALLDRKALAGAHILELGAGTGLLSILLSPLVAQYTVTDIVPILPLIRKNLLPNFPGWHPSPSPSHSSPSPFPPDKPGANIHVEELDWTALDCIYNPALLPALVDTLDWVADSGAGTQALVVMELRQEDVVREFLALWLARGWEVRRVEGLLGARYVIWVGSDHGAEFIPAREWMEICFGPHDLFKAHKKGLRRAAVNSFGYITKPLDPQTVLPPGQERQSQGCSTVVAIVAGTYTCLG
ncbi:hypothetical protein FIBSPDRAFT_945911 [Athelia psychrophila]|uniref:Uncharacterized protein n=1 Tax=Athelia psychrophila TaxID=1759441 RepID=A0A166TFA2_9AGAM|nr:hypothetical protein FIBSPDRAFT_945911 [Fibularhizoctonia sp. CBS 109695]